MTQRSFLSTILTCSVLMTDQDSCVELAGIAIVWYWGALPYSRKYWRSIKFGGLAIGEATVKFKSVKFKCDLRIIHIILRVRVRAYYMYGTTAKFKSAKFLFRPLGTKPPNLKIANISGYTHTVYAISAPTTILPCSFLLQ